MREIKKVLFCATVDYHFQLFHLPYLKWFKECGWEVHVAASGQHTLPYVDEKFEIDFQRSPFNKTNLSAYKKLKAVINANDYGMIHCHTPMGGVLTRLAAKKARKNGTKVIYTAHGFHFCKGAPAANWLFYYPIERMLARQTDCLITINREDEELARRHRFQAGIIEHVHGVGVDTERFKPIEKEQKDELRRAYGYEPDAFLMFYAAEFNKNKNQSFLIRSLALVKDQIPNARLLLAGQGPLWETCRKLAVDLGVDDRVDFLGYRNDIESLLKQSDLAVASSLREGLPVNIMEAMACGLPVVASDNRGHRELVADGVNGYIVPMNDERRMATEITRLARDDEMCHKAGEEGRKKIDQLYNIEKVTADLSKIYTQLMERTGELKWAYQ